LISSTFSTPCICREIWGELGTKQQHSVVPPPPAIRRSSPRIRAPAGGTSSPRVDGAPVVTEGNLALAVTKGNLAPLIRPPGSFATPPILRGRHRHRAGALILAPRAAGHRCPHLPLPIVALTSSSLRRRRTPHGSRRGGRDTVAPVRPWHGGRPRRGMPGCW
jgi:hypothetical protein